MSSTLRFDLNRQKAIEATAHILSLAGGVLDIFNVVKSVYLADKISLHRRGRPICGGKYSSMENGPVPKDVYVRVTSYGSDPWSEYFEKPRDENWLRLLQPIPPKHLTTLELEILQEAYNRWGILPFQGLWQQAHDPTIVPEYKPQPKGGESEIPVEDILRAMYRDGGADAAIERAQRTVRQDALVEAELPQVEV